MNKISFLGIGIIFICLNLLGCNPHDDYVRHFKIINNSDASIYIAFSYSYPDTSLSKINNIPYSNANQTQKVFSKNSLSQRTGVFEISSTCLMFIFDAHTIETTPWDSIVKHNKVLKRYQLTKSDMEKMNWIVTYP